MAGFEMPAVLAGDLTSTDRGLDYRTLMTEGHLDDGMRKYLDEE